MFLFTKVIHHPTKDDYRFITVQRGDIIIAKAINVSNGWVVCSAYPSGEKGFIHSSICKFLESKTKEHKRANFDFQKEIDIIRVNKAHWFETYTKDPVLGSFYSEIFDSMNDFTTEFFKIARVREKVLMNRTNIYLNKYLKNSATL